MTTVSIAIGKCGTRHNDTQYNDTQHNESHHNDTQYNGTQRNDSRNNNKKIVTLSTSALRIMTVSLQIRKL
jgi:hypothetical protein